jgi:NAD-dependent dihydropyrimidine dehydrogenase PreA subunit/predicted transcriptional regulator
MSFELVVDEELCSGCGNCIVACPVNALNDIEASGGKGSDLTPLIKIEGGTTYIVDQKACNGCGVCIQACSYNAILVDAAKPEPSSKLVKVKELKIPGEKGQVYEMVKEKGPLTIPQISKELNLPPRLVLTYISSLRKEGRIWEQGTSNGTLYTAEKIEVVEAEEEREEAVIPKIDPELVKKIRERMDIILNSLSTVKMKFLIETDKLEKAKEEMKHKLR